MHAFRSQNGPHSTLHLFCSSASDTVHLKLLLQEETRLEQLESLAGSIDKARPHIVCGDFNSLLEEDYTPGYLEDISRVRRAGNWEEPRFEVTRRMLQLGYCDVFARLNPKSRDRKRASCRFGTRIDYIWMCPRLVEFVDWEQTKAALSGTPQLSDHRAVVLKLVLRASGSDSSAI